MLVCKHTGSNVSELIRRGMDTYVWILRITGQLWRGRHGQVENYEKDLEQEDQVSFWRFWWATFNSHRGPLRQVATWGNKGAEKSSNSSVISGKTQAPVCVTYSSTYLQNRDASLYLPCLLCMIIKRDKSVSNSCK